MSDEKKNISTEAERETFRGDIEKWVKCVNEAFEIYHNGSLAGCVPIEVGHWLVEQLEGVAFLKSELEFLSVIRGPAPAFVITTISWLDKVDKYVKAVVVRDLEDSHGHPLVNVDLHKIIREHRVEQ